MKIAQRIHLKQLLKDADYDCLLAFLLKYRDAFDELTLFTGFCHHGAIPLDELRPQAEILKRRIADLRVHGFTSIGLNVHTTFGHIDEGYEDYGQPFHPMVGYDGTVSKACFCPEHEDMKQFLRDKYTMYAETKPDFMWVDDDVKFFWNGVKFACFCPKCMDRFNRRMHTAYSREQLVADMEVPENIDLRAAWVNDISDRITELFAMLRRTVDGVDPRIRLGFQTQHQGWSTYNGMDFAKWFPALGACMGRPGEGTYDDKTPLTLCTKALSCARQASEYPACITDIQYEIEDFPNYSTLQKSVRFNCDEITLAVTQGMNGILINSLNPSPKMNGLGLDALYEKLIDLRANWDKIEAFGKGMHGVGFYPAISHMHDRRRTLVDGESFFHTYDEMIAHRVTDAYALGHIGLPLTMDAGAAYGAVFTGQLPDGFTDEELIRFLSCAVIADAEALRCFERRGMGKYLGVTGSEKKYTDSIEEVFTDHPVNAGYAGVVRDIHPAFYGGHARILAPISDSVQVISMLNNMHDQPIGIAGTLYENELGGRVCVLGYGAFQRIDCDARQAQMRRAAEWLCRGNAVTRLDKTWLAQQFVRTDGSRTIVTIINLSLDVMKNAQIDISGARCARILHDGDDAHQAAEICGVWGRFNLPDLLPYETCTLLAE